LQNKREAIDRDHIGAQGVEQGIMNHPKQQATSDGGEDVWYKYTPVN
jgi:hypothetical protein